MRVSQVSMAVLLLWVITALYFLLSDVKPPQCTHSNDPTGPVFPNRPTTTVSLRELDVTPKSEIVKKCIDPTLLNIEGLPQMVGKWKASSYPVCQQLHHLFTKLYHLESRQGTLNMTDGLRGKMMGWFGGNKDLVKAVELQTIIFVRNKWTYEGTVFNPIRDKRPIKKPPISDRQYVEDLAKTSEEGGCDFCQQNYKKYTSPDFYERIESKHCYTASNAFKLDAWHALVIFRKHSPNKWNQEEMMDVFSVAMQWFERVRQHHKDFIYPMIFWDLLPHASASQVHPHIHLVVTNTAYWGLQEGLRQIGYQYHIQSSRVFLDDIAAVHNILGLKAQHGTASAYASITPKKDYETVITSKNANKDFFEMIYYATRAYIDDLEKFCFSMAITLPPLDPEKSDLMTAHIRMVSRGTVSEVRSDVSSMELFSASNVNVDPFKFSKVLLESVKKRSHE